MERPSIAREESAGAIALQRATLQQTLDAIALLQRGIRRRRWRTLIGSGIPLVRGPNGIVFFPVYTPEARLVGVQGRTRDYMGTAFGMAPDHPRRLQFPIPPPPRLRLRLPRLLTLPRPKHPAPRPRCRNLHR